MADEELAHWTVEDLIPHRGRMKLVETPLKLTEDRAVTGAVVRETWPLVSGGATPALVLVELIAQSASLLIGWKRRHVEKQGGTGVLVGVREASFACDRVTLGAELTTRVEVLRSFGSYVVFGGTVSQGERRLCSVEIQAFRPEALGTL